MKNTLKKTMKDSMFIVGAYSSMNFEFLSKVVLQIMPINDSIFIAEIVDKKIYEEMCRNLLEDLTN